MNVVIWARVSSREQREGYSIDAQLRATRDKAEREGWKVVREFAVAESAKRGAEQACGDMPANRGDKSLAVFDFTQQAGDRRLGSKMEDKRTILDQLSLNQTLSDTTLCLVKRKPFDILAEGLSVQPSRGGGI
jgi:DNA invertase Pin-like site-specific DNA recombinase